MPHIVILTGPSAAGKTTLSQHLLATHGEEFEHVRQDDYLKDPSTFPVVGEYRVWEVPENLQFDTLVSHIEDLKIGKPASWRTFARDESESSYEYTLTPKPYVLLDGTLLLTHPHIRKLADTVIYLDVPLRVSLARRAERAKRWALDLSSYDRDVTAPIYRKYRRLKHRADHVIDGTRPVEENAQRVLEILNRDS